MIRVTFGTDRRSRIIAQRVGFLSLKPASVVRV